jgi:hypothetical protein
MARAALTLRSLDKRLATAMRAGFATSSLPAPHQKRRRFNGPGEIVRLSGIPYFDHVALHRRRPASRSRKVIERSAGQAIGACERGLGTRDLAIMVLESVSACCCSKPARPAPLSEQMGEMSIRNTSSTYVERIARQAFQQLIGGTG